MPAFLGLFLFLPQILFAQGEGSIICEVEPNSGCYSPNVPVDSLFIVQSYVVGIRQNGLNICNESEVSTGSKDIVLIMDNTGSMANEWVDNDGIAHYCDRNTEYGQPDYPDPQNPDPNCISGDPDGLRAPAFHEFLDSALVKSGGLANVGVVLFNESVTYSSGDLQPLTSETIDDIKMTIVNDAERSTNYYAAMAEAMNILSGSSRPKSEQVIIFLSDGRPNRPLGDPYIYKNIWDSWPTTHTIFLGANVLNQQDLFDISEKTGGTFYPVSDVSTLASLLTEDIIDLIFVGGVPNMTLVTNLATNRNYDVPASGHNFNNGDSGMYTLELPGPIYLDTGLNEIRIITSYTNGLENDTTSFKVHRGEVEGEEFSWLEEPPVCRSMPYFTLYNDDDRPISSYLESYQQGDEALTYHLHTKADVDEFSVNITTTQGDEEDQENTKDVNQVNDSLWVNNIMFDHQADEAIPDDLKVQGEDGMTITLFYQNPYIPMDSASISIQLKYGPGVKNSVAYDLDEDGRMETIVINFDESIEELPDQLRFVVLDNGIEHERLAQESEGEIEFSGSNKSQITVTLNNPFPFGVTDIEYPDDYGQTFRQDNVPISASTFPMLDSVPPVISHVEAEDPGTGSTQIITVTFSEAVDVKDEAKNPITIFRKDTNLTDNLIDILGIVEVEGKENQYEIEISSSDGYYVIEGDSVAITPNGEIGDKKGNVPKSLIFTTTKGEAPLQEIGKYTVSHPEDQARNVDPDLVKNNSENFILVDSRGIPISGSKNGKCDDCTVQTGDGDFIGPVIKFVTEFPVSYTFVVYSNLGHYLTTSSGKITTDDFVQMRDVSGADALRPRYEARVVWDGMIDDGIKVGSGVYILKAIFKYDPDETLGAAKNEYDFVSRVGFVN